VEKLMADHGFSERRACRLIGVNRSAWQYEPLRGQDDAVRVRMREIANERRRFGYRRLAILLKREGKGMNLKKDPMMIVGRRLGDSQDWFATNRSEGIACVSSPCLACRYPRRPRRDLRIAGTV
jgi:hypothetical protein